MGNTNSRSTDTCIAIFSVCHNAEFVHSKTLAWLRYTDILFPILLVFWVTAYYERNKKNRTCGGERVEEGLQSLYDDTHEMDFLQSDGRAEKICEFLSKNIWNTEGAIRDVILGENMRKENVKGDVARSAWLFVI